MAELTTSGVVRDILTRDPEMQTDEIVRLAKRRGLTVPDEKIRHSVHNQRNTIRAQATGTAKVAPAAARETTPSKVAPISAAPISVTTAASTPTPELAGVLANVALVNTIVGLCGSVENTRQAAEAVEACGGLEAFLRHLELVASIRGAGPAA